MNKRVIPNDLVRGPDQRNRCWWCVGDPLYTRYHDQEWGNPVYEDHRLFEKMCLEGFQAGLAWITVLKKREAFRDAFCGFDFRKVARFTPDDVDRLVQDPGIIRHRGKIRSTINNAQRAVAMTDAGLSLSEFFWQFKPIDHVRPKAKQDIAATTPQSTAMSKALKDHGWTFVGPTTCYALMQATGMVNDHLVGCDFDAPA